MKKLSTAAKSIEASASKAVTTTNTQSLGLIKEAGKQTGLVKPAQPLLDHNQGVASVQAQADLVKSLMQQKKPKKCYEDKMRRSEERGDIKYYRTYFWQLPELTAEEQHIIEQSQLPCPKDKIINLISRYLEVHKKHIIEGQEKRLVLYTDMAGILYGLPEYALTLGVLDIVNDSSITWFPNVGKIREAAEKYLIKWPENLEGGEELYT